ncbi:MAG: hypothetical protein COT91_04560 [Candidatus Doudnabacteria bacterium CG10_big_fil_rev_8_21_14_0_10_41_10]|uniref:Uncharacterized protein n=1 Tax=Candidatus Doudnabacteria bacterium CG10_big_fil_rev_8_21_14_0_10_41_10 TaxID=1974551 RepID=A0A2H0VCN6_9BACT|nr:MAG: hypothetical protein COT91_04560 [Candidatus Doudnabacteria bacterium CG10_big_fil_rev_8_21_14_0_10_41_10]
MSHTEKRFQVLFTSVKATRNNRNTFARTVRIFYQKTRVPTLLECEQAPADARQISSKKERTFFFGVAE